VIFLPSPLEGEGGERSEPGEGSMKDPHHQRVTATIRGHARRMRHDSTGAEAKMWHVLRNRRLVGFKFRRQVPFRNYILDFVCFQPKIVIEIDGSQHASSETDNVRDALLREEGFRVVRYWNNDVLQRSDSVLEDIFAHLHGWK
jgi:very-short-patch-repair endonuclease